MKKNEKVTDYEQLIKEQGFVCNTIVGRSMYPMLRNRKDTIVVKKVSGRLKKYDVPLYKRDGKYILHRIIAVKSDHYVIRGDNCYEREYVTDDMIIGVLSDFYRGEKKIQLDNLFYKSYVIFWRYTFGIRFLLKKVRGALGRVKRTIQKR